MPNSRNRTTEEIPSRRSIVIMTLISAAVATATWWVVNGGDHATLDSRHLVGFMLGVLAMVMLVSQTMDRLTKRVLARIKARHRQHETEALMRVTQDGQDG